MHGPDGAKRSAAFVATTGATLIAVVCGVLLLPDCASACSCAAPAGTSPQELARQELSNSDAVFAGEVVDIDGALSISGSVDPMTVTFRVSESWKGAGGETVDVQTAVSDASCGYPFDEGEGYLVFASKGIFFEEGELEVGLCGSTKPLSKARAELAALGPGAAPTGPPAAGERLPDTSGALPGLKPTSLLLLSGAGAVTLVFAAAIRSSGGRWTRR